MKQCFRLIGSVAWLSALLALAGCGIQQAAPIAEVRVAKPSDVPGGDPERGKRAIDRSSCGACHVVPGVAGANGAVGPPLDRWARRAFIAGNLPNTPDNLVWWILDPQAVEPGTAMPNLGVGLADARDMAAYLYTLD